MRDITNDVISKLCASGIHGFENFDTFVKQNMPTLQFEAKEVQQLQDLERQYRETQEFVLRKLLNFNYFSRSEPPLVNREVHIPEDTREDPHKESLDIADKLDQEDVY